MLRGIRRTLLAGSADIYGVFTVDTAELPANLGHELDASIAVWKTIHRAVWLSLKEDQLSLLPLCIARGFKTHSCDPSTNTLLLSLWLSNEVSTLPFYSNHYAGVGGVILDDSDNCLLIKTQRSPIIIQWRVPGGLVETDEDFETAVMREVIEETGVKTKVIGLLGMRERTNYLFGRRDIYSLFLLEPLSFDIEVTDTHEISDCKWMPAKQWLDDTTIGDAVNMVKAIAPASGSLKEALKQKTYSRVTHDWNLPNFKARHYFWLKT